MFTTIYKYLIIIVLFIPLLSMGHELEVNKLQLALKADNLNATQQVEIILRLANAYQNLGLSQQAIKILLKAEKIDKSTLLDSKVYSLLSDLYLTVHQDVKARHYIDKSLQSLPKNAPAIIQATVLNNLGNILTIEAYYAKAIRTYAKALKLATGSAELSGRIANNISYAYIQNNQQNEAVNMLLIAEQHFNSLADNYSKAFGLIGVGKLAIQLEANKIAYQVLNDALKFSKQYNRLISYAYGFLGHLYEKQQRYTEALQLTRKAIFFAKLDGGSFFSEQNQASEILYRWQWQLGRLFKVLNDIDTAIETYQQAVQSLQPIRQEMAIGYRNDDLSFRERIGPIYFELADLLLQRATTQTDLKAVIDVIEVFKTAELQDYFQDDCVIKSSQTLWDKNLATNVGVFYPILLPDRTEILLKLSKDIYRFNLPIGAERLKDEVNEFRFELEDYSTTNFLSYAQRLYKWLIIPFHNLLKTRQIDTLIFIPDGVLRTIPFAALHDGNDFLISKYNIVVNPGLNLNGAKSTKPAKILLNGLATGVQGFNELSSVTSEIESISKLYSADDVTKLLNKQFTVNNFTTKLEQTNYSILHVASHGQFNSDLKKTFLLAYDGKINMNKLEKLIRLSERRSEPLELLTLSACQTAVGDDQAALGLAGVALKAGAKSALASLWAIDDDATAILMQKFYQQLHVKQLSKAKALQMAQLKLLKYRNYKHPAYWASFLLIGNWQ
ncbi:CHAT domain-containing protein [Candidatus Halobeggiatoa sp. HSG11]|nr:CHAT domain-containing protein [Candidatus Halobeggiatoa sp. HSG11]